MKNKQGIEIENEIEAGWTYDHCIGACYHFEHIRLDLAENEMERATQVHVIETVNTTLATNRQTHKQDPNQVHRNIYFADNLDRAIGLAARMVIENIEVAEVITAIRPATGTEIQLYEKMQDYQIGMEPGVFQE